ncbi:MAG TPA: response regulator transcription factor [Candidatus Sulfotelmatobacter sp.]|nr:response regulator transcription factor [Candidatus Sulfotelmatobacter sp.]
MKILIVEDEHKIANLIRQGLEQERYTVDVAYDGASGFDLASEDNYDLIILDRLLPKMDGLTICKKLREDEKHVPILMLTAKAQIMDRVEGLESGADDYLTKPFAFEELLARIKALSRRPRETSLGKSFQVSDLVLNTATYEVKRNHKKILLSSKEFALLEYLMRNKNKILSKEQIINHVWSYESNILPNTVEVFIGYLRNKIDKSFKKDMKLIHTKRGFGYSIGVENNV